MKNREKRREAQVPLFFRALLFAALCLTPPVFEAVPASAAMPDAKFIDLCASGEIGAIRQAIKGGANPNAHNQYGGTALMFAVNNNENPDVIRALLEAGADINAKDDGGGTALMGAALFGDDDNAAKIKALLEGKPVLNAQKTGNWEKGWTALMVAARASEAAKRIKLLLAAGADMNLQGGEGETALIIAAQCGKPDAVRVLLAAGANAQIQDKNGHDALWHGRNSKRSSKKDAAAVTRLLEQCGTPAQRAANALCGEDSPEALAARADNEFANLCKNGKAEAVRQALKKGANPNAESESGWTALMLAAEENGDPEVVKALLAAGADINHKTDRGWTALLRAVLGNKNPEVAEALLDAGADAKVMLKDGSTTALMLAAEHNPDAVPALLDAGANVNAQNDYGWTALWHAAVRGHTEAVQALLAAGANVNTGIDGGGTALMSAGDDETARILLKAGAELNAKDKNGMTALMHAAQYGKSDVVKSLLFAGADKNITDGKGHNALWHAQHPEKDVDASACVPLLQNDKFSDEDFIDLCKEGTPEMVRQALKNGSNLQARDEDGRTALMWAAWENANPQVIHELLSAGASPDARAANGETALMYAAQSDTNPEAVKLLLDAGADINAQNRWGQTALMMAAQDVQIEAVKVLLSAGANAQIQDENGHDALWHAQNLNEEERISDDDEACRAVIRLLQDGAKEKEPQKKQ